jgi:hypothetical protein
MHDFSLGFGLCDSANRAREATGRLDKLRVLIRRGEV